MTWEQFCAMSESDQLNYRRARAKRLRSLRAMRKIIAAIREAVTEQSRFPAAEQ